MKTLRYFLFALVLVSAASADTYYEKTTIPPTIAANKVLGNGTASTAAPQQLAVGSCSTTASALIWTTSTGFGCNTAINAGTLGGATFAAPGAIGGGTPAAGAFTTLTSSSGMPLSSLATQATNTVVGNATSGTAVPTALAVGTCSTSASALNWTTNTGFGCNTAVNAGTLGGATFAAPGSIGGGTPASGAFTALSGTTFAFAAGTSFSGASWGTTSPVFNSAAMTLNDTTASGTDANEVAYSLQAPTFTSTGGASTTITNAATLWLAAPVCSGGVVCTNLFSLIANGRVLGLAGGLVQGGTISLNVSSNNTTSINGGTNNTALTLGGTTAGNSVNLASVGTRFANVLYESATAPTINAHFNTSSDTITASSTAAFKVTVGTSTGTSTGSLTMPTASNGWACSVANVTNPAGNMVQQTASTTTGVTVTNYTRTTGVAANFTNSDVLVFVCGAF